VGDLRHSVRGIGLAVVGIVLMAGYARGEAAGRAEAVRLNNRGVAQMGQQFTEKAADSFADAMKADPKLAQAAYARLEGLASSTAMVNVAVVDPAELDAVTT
jgi:hypothetical protein